MTLGALPDLSLPDGWRQVRGKVRDVVQGEDRMVVVTTDRVSAFDRILSEVPHKGEILNRLSVFWFRKTADIVPNHLIEELTPRTVVVRRAQVLPVEVVVRGYLTGSAWRDYRASGEISGIRPPAGLDQFAAFDSPIITPSTKAESGHDRPISVSQLTSTGLVEGRLWKEVEDVALALFARGSAHAAERGLILVDTKYEFGLIDGRLHLVDEVHTPDSSRYWYAADYDRRRVAGEAPRQMDKEFLRSWLMERGYMGDGEPPPIDKATIRALSERYRVTFETLTGLEFVPTDTSVEAETSIILSYLSRAH